MNIAADKNLKMTVRSADRSRVRVDSTVHYMKQIADCRIIDISRKGLAVELYTAFHAAAGSTIMIENDEIGALEGIIRWNRGGRLGIQFRPKQQFNRQSQRLFPQFSSGN